MIITNAATMDAYEKALDKLKDRILEQADEIERLREALQQVADIEGGDIDVIWKAMRSIARTALKEKEKE